MKNEVIKIEVQLAVHAYIEYQVRMRAMIDAAPGVAANAPACAHMTFI